MAATHLMALICGLLAVCLPLTAAQSAYSYIGNISVKAAAFSNVFEHPNYADDTERYSIIISSIDSTLNTSDSNYILLYPGKALNDLENFQPTLMYTGFVAPRELGQVPVGAVAGISEAVYQPDAFILPTKENGSIWITDLTDYDNPVTFDIIRDPNNPTDRLWFYHDVQWYDADRDGDQDAFTCRGYQFGIPDKEYTQFLWLEQPDSNPLGQVWTQHVIHENITDTFLFGRSLSVPSGETFYAIFTIGYFTEKFTVQWSTAPDGSWANNDDIQTRVIDEGRWYFYIEPADINKDGRMDIACAWSDPDNGSFVAYEIPDDFRTDPFPQHVLSTGFSTRDQTPGSPGAGVVYYPTADESGKPWIALSGDGDGRFYYLTPNSEDPSDWGYTRIQIADFGPDNLIAQQSVVDTNGDGRKEIYIPVFDQDVLAVYDYTP